MEFPVKDIAKMSFQVMAAGQMAAEATSLYTTAPKGQARLPECLEVTQFLPFWSVIFLNQYYTSSFTSFHLHLAEAALCPIPVLPSQEALGYHLEGVSHVTELNVLSSISCFPLNLFTGSPAQGRGWEVG